MLNEFEARNRFQLSAGGCGAAVWLWWLWASNQAGPHVLAIVADAVNVIKTFFLPNHNFADGASRCRPQSTHRAFTYSPTQNRPFTFPHLPFPRFPPASSLLDWVIALLIKCISYALTFYLCMRAQVEPPQPQRTHVGPLVTSILLLLHPPLGALSVCPLNLFENYACLGNARKPGNGRRLTMANG